VMATPTYSLTHKSIDGHVTQEPVVGSDPHTQTSLRKERNMSSTPTISQGIERIGALLDRLDPRIDGVCDVAGCIHHAHHEPRLADAGVGTA
jgi:hypothetical protein